MFVLSYRNRTAAASALGHACRARNHFLKPPPLQLRKRPRGNNSHHIAHTRVACFIVRVVLFAGANHSLVQRMLRGASDLHHDRLLHLRAGYHPDQFLPRSTRRRCHLLNRCCFVSHYAFLNSFSRKIVLTRAKSRFASRSFFKPSACPVEIWKRRRKICSESSFCRTSSSFAFISRYLSARRAIRVPPPGLQTWSEWAACAPPVASLRSPTPSQHLPFRTSRALALLPPPNAPVDPYLFPFEFQRASS